MLNIKEKLTSALALPKEIALNLAVVTIMGQGEIAVENYKNLLEFSETKIRIRTHNQVISIEGERLVLQQITTENLTIVGRITTISYI